MRPLTLALLVSLCGMAEDAHAQDATTQHAACLRDHEQAQEVRLRSDYVAARQHLLACAQRHCPGPVNSECIAWLAEVERSLPSVVFAVVGDAGHDLVPVRVLADGRLLTERLDGRALSINPGVYHLRFEAEGYSPAERVLTVHEAQKQRLIHVELVALKPGTSARSTSEREPERPPGRRRLLASGVMAGTAVASLAAGIGLGVAGKIKYDHLDASCPATCSEAQQRHGANLWVGADVAFGVAVGAAAAAVWLFVSARHGDRAPHRAWLRWQPAVHRSGASLGYRAPF